MFHSAVSILSSSDELQKAVTMLKTFLSRFVEPKIINEEERNEYDKIVTSLDSSPLLLRVWIAYQLVPDQPNRFENIIGKILHDIQTPVPSDVVALFRKILERLCTSI